MTRPESHDAYLRSSKRATVIAPSLVPIAAYAPHAAAQGTLVPPGGRATFVVTGMICATVSRSGVAEDATAASAGSVLLQASPRACGVSKRKPTRSPVADSVTCVA